MLIPVPWLNHCSDSTFIWACTFRAARYEHPRRIVGWLWSYFYLLCATFCPNSLCWRNLFLLPVNKNQKMSAEISQPHPEWEGLLYFQLFSWFYNGNRMHGIQETDAHTSAWRPKSKSVKHYHVFWEVSSFFWCPCTRHNHSPWTPSLRVAPGLMDCWILQVMYFSFRFTSLFSQARNQTVNLLSGLSVKLFWLFVI